jgi:Tol biopolymer transport system component
VLATSFPARTFDVTLLGAGRSTPAADPAISGNGLTVAFDSPSAAGGREVYSANLLTETRTLISTSPLGAAAPGTSSDPSISADGSTVAFVSTAGDLAAGASKTQSNVYVRLPDGSVELVSGGVAGAVANGAASQPAISSNGLAVAFTSTASNLVSGLQTVGPQVFVRNLVTRVTTLVSVARNGTSGNGWAGDASINATGRYVSFDSAASDLQQSPSNHIANVYVRDLASGRTQIVSVTSGGTPQNQAQPAPFHQISSISANGRYVVFDSEGSNLVLNDVNRSSDVFLRDTYRHTTILISENNAGYEGNNDSFAPTISADGTKVAFESFASNLAPGGGPQENVFERDLTLGTTSVIDVGPQGQPPTRERVSELLQRPVLSSNGYVAAFESTAANLTDSASTQTHTFLRLMAPPIAAFSSAPPARTNAHSIAISVHADDPAASVFLCQLDGHAPVDCRPGTITFSHLSSGRHVLSIRAGGPGMLYQPIALKSTVTVR